MTKKQVLRYLDVLIDRARLQAYDIQVHFHEEGDVDDTDEAIAACNSDATYFRAHIAIYSGFFRQPLAEQQQALAHELAHVILAEYDQLIGKLTEGGRNSQVSEHAAQQIGRLLCLNENG